MHHHCLQELLNYTSPSPVPLMNVKLIPLLMNTPLSLLNPQLKKTRPSDRNHKLPEYSIEVMTNGNFPGAPPIWELAEEPAEGIDTKASVIEALATARWKEEHPEEAAEAAAAAAAAEPVATTVSPPEAAPEMAEEVAVIADEVAEAVAEEVIGVAVEEVVAEAVE